jgi:NAD(P)H-dependent flavin oxidoreductase YrpB (nitropropane dioxygenase family)
MKTGPCDRIAIELSIVQAPMGGAVGPALAAAVGDAGGLGTLRRQIRETRTRTSRPYGVTWHCIASIVIKELSTIPSSPPLA